MSLSVLLSRGFTKSDAVIEDPDDVVVRVSSSAICGTDLHRVNCARGLSAACLRVRPGGFGAAYGYAGMGPYRGAQAELLRVPFADANCIPVPGEPGDELEDDLVLLADAFVTGWHATVLGEVTAGATVAVFGAGTIGLLAAYSALFKGAAEVYVVDAVPERLDKAGEIGAVPVDYRQGDPVEQIRELRRAGGLAPGEAAMRSPVHRSAPGSRPVRAGPPQRVTHHGPLDDAPALYRAFDERADGVIKAVLRP
jgi:glutathione-independent formaldehyde dehydrogenase